MRNFTGLELRVLRKMCGLTCEQLGNLCGVSKQTISNWELEKQEMIKVVRVGIITILSSKYPEEVKTWNRMIETGEMSRIIFV